MDETFVVLHSDENDKFLRHINTVDPNIKLAQVDIYDNRLSFLNCFVTIDTDHTLSANIFRKDAHTDEYLNFQSNHPPHQKLWLDKTLFHRADNLMSKPDEMFSEQ